MIDNSSKKNILVAPLNWGLGHATRCIPIINNFLENNHNVIIASSGEAYMFLKKQFPQLICLQLIDYKIKYSANRNHALALFMQLPYLLFAIFKEHKQIKKISQKFIFDYIVSDNRFGCWNSKIYSVFITHQLKIILPNKLNFIQNLASRVNAFFINKYKECWIPDDDIENLSNPFFDNKFVNICVKKIGLLSRFKNYKNSSAICNIDFVCILSGPEPQRSILFKILLNIFSSSHLNVVIVSGIESSEERINTNIIIKGCLGSTQLLSLINQSKYVVCRSGYSSIMDLIALNKQAILIPTPGMPEQELLAKELKNRPNFKIILQKELSLKKFENYYKTYK